MIVKNKKIGNMNFSSQDELLKDSIHCFIRRNKFTRAAAEHL